MEENTKNVYLIDVGFEVNCTELEAVQLFLKVGEFVRECDGNLYKLELGKSPF